MIAKVLIDNITKNDLISENSIRVSLSYLNTKEEILTFVKELKNTLKEIK